MENSARRSQRRFKSYKRANKNAFHWTKKAGKITTKEEVIGRFRFLKNLVKYDSHNLGAKYAKTKTLKG